LDTFVHFLTTSILLVSLFTSGFSYGGVRNIPLFVHVLEHHINFENHSHHDPIESDHNHEDSQDPEATVLIPVETDTDEQGKPVEQHRHNLQNNDDQQWLGRSNSVRKIFSLPVNLKFHFRSSLFSTDFADLLFRPPIIS